MRSSRLCLCKGLAQVSLLLVRGRYNNHHRVAIGGRINDFGIDITKMHGVMRVRTHGFLKTASLKDRTLLLESGPGCDPQTGTRRFIKGKWSDGMREEISSYDLEYVVDSAGKKIQRLPEEQFDIEAVQVQVELPKPKSKPRGRDAWKGDK